jgi:hypothetical protein
LTSIPTCSSKSTSPSPSEPTPQTDPSQPEHISTVDRLTKFFRSIKTKTIQGDPKAQAIMGTILMTGSLQVKQDPETGLKFLVLAGTAKNSPSKTAVTVAASVPLPAPVPVVARVSSMPEHATGAVAFMVPETGQGSKGLNERSAISAGSHTSMSDEKLESGSGVTAIGDGEFIFFLSSLCLTVVFCLLLK